jgi:hypothetical protein
MFSVVMVKICTSQYHFFGPEETNSVVRLFHFVVKLKILVSMGLIMWSANLKMVWYVLLRPLRPELDGHGTLKL